MHRFIVPVSLLLLAASLPADAKDLKILTGAGMAIVKAISLSPAPLGLKLQGDAMGGLLTFYLVVTALLTLRR